MCKVNSNDVEDTEDKEETNHQVKSDDDSDNVSDDDTKIDLADLFPNTDDNPVEYIYTKDATGRVVAVDSRFKVPREQIEVVVTYDEKGCVIDREYCFKAKADVPEKEKNID